MHLNTLGKIVEEEWLRSAEIRPRLQLDSFVVMPNHLHGVLVIEDQSQGPAPASREQFGKPTSDSIPTIVRLFKSSTTNRINRLRGTPRVAVWQRNYYEHVIRSESDWHKIREYIETNPLRWDKDPENSK